jgi:transposase
VTVRRFRCRNPRCERATFAEGFGEALPRRAHRTAAASQLLLRFAVVAGGEAGARLATAAGLPASPDTLLRLVRCRVDPEPVTPRILGVDDFALRRGHRYATILVDLETRRPIDLLADREASSLAEWLRGHPGVQVIVRDRSLAYAEGAAAGAPHALQVADRFHLVKNASGALDEVLGRRHAIRITSNAGLPPDPTDEWTMHDAPSAVPVPEPPLSKTVRLHAERQARRTAWWEEIRRRRAIGQSISQIAREVGKDRKTVRRYLAATDPPPTRTIVAPRIGGLRSPTLSPFVEYVQGRWQQGCHNASQLYRELIPQGYSGRRRGGCRLPLAAAIPGTGEGT